MKLYYNMFVRIVKLSFQENKITEFTTYFHIIKDRIRNYPGCEFLELYQDKDHPNVFFTYSYWNDPQDLENYKNSDTFKEIWPFVKTLFSDRPQAWSVDKVATLN